MIEPSSEKQSADFLSWRRSHENQLPADLPTDPPEGSNAQKTYVIDINNDGVKEYVVTYDMGSAHIITIFVFSKNKTGDYKYIGEGEERETLLVPKNLTEYASHYSYEYINPLNQKSELFFEMCGKIYISAHNSQIHENIVREVFLLEKTETKLMCTPQWISIHRSFFKKLYDQSMYSNAHSYLNGILQSCENILSKKNIFWLKNDIALAAFKNNDAQTCLEHLEYIKKDPIFQSNSSDKSLTKAVLFNEKLCLNKLKADMSAGNAGTYDYSWLFSFIHPDVNLVYDDKRYENFLSVAVPRIINKKWDKPDGLLKEFIPRLENWRNPLKFKENRFITLHGCIPMSCKDHGLIWIDSKKSISAIIMNASEVSIWDGRNKNDTTLIIASRSISRNSLPKEFINDLKTWLKDEKIEFKNAIFYDYSENSKDVTDLLQ